MNKNKISCIYKQQRKVEYYFSIIVFSFKFSLKFFLYTFPIPACVQGLPYAQGFTFVKYFFL